VIPDPFVSLGLWADGTDDDFFYSTLDARPQTDLTMAAPPSGSPNRSSSTTLTVVSLYSLPCCLVAFGHALEPKSGGNYRRRASSAHGTAVSATLPGTNTWVGLNRLRQDRRRARSGKRCETLVLGRYLLSSQQSGGNRRRSVVRQNRTASVSTAVGDNGKRSGNCIRQVRRC
jgi:hypothetical protein